MHRLLICTILLLALGVSTTTAVESVESVESDALAHKLINSQGCKACHSLGGEGGTFAISLEQAGQKLTPVEILQQLVNPKRQHGNGHIPDFAHLSATEIDALVEFLKQSRDSA